jgi:putative ABC transport system permease protein
MQNLLRHLLISARSAGRHFRRNRLYGGLNVLGLSIALASLMLVMTYLYQETTYESFHQKADRIYRPTYKFSGQGDFEVHFARIPVDFINQLPEEMPEIEQLIRFQNQEQKYVRIGEERFKPEHAYVTDEEVFSVFNLPLIEGNPATALAQPQSVVLTESIAQKYFSRTNVVGEELMVLGTWSVEESVYQVTGIIEDLPANTHLPIELLFSFAGEQERSGWAYVYTLLEENSEIAAVTAKLPGFIQKYADEDSQGAISFEFQPLKDIHLQSDLAREIIPNGSLLYVNIFFWTGLFIWIIALINFANLHMAMSMNRGKEMGVRKILGAANRHLFFSALAESTFYSLAALCLGAILASAVFPYFSQLMGVYILPPMQYFIPVLVGIAVSSGLLAGIFPAGMLSSVRVLQMIRQGNNWSMKGRAQKINLKRVMITVQFCATIILVGGAIAAHLQFRYIQKKNLGLQADQVMVIPDVPDRVKNSYLVFKNRLEELPGVRQVAACMQVPSSEIRDVGPVLVRGKSEDPSQAAMMDMQVIDPDFIDMMGIELMAGEDFTQRVTLQAPPPFNEELNPADYLRESPRSYLINETAMKQLGWQEPSEAIGQEINWSIGPYTLAYGPVTGVVADFHQESLRNKVDPILMIVEPIWLGNILLKVGTKDLSTTIAEVETIWNELFPYAMEYQFMDELFNKLYQKDQVQLKLLSALSLIAIIISFIGLISLVAFALKRRAKELAIRRVVGADLKALTTLIGREYFWIVAIAAAIGIPLSYYWVMQWMQNFAYHMDLSLWIYFLAVAVVYFLLLTTIYLQTRKATVDNPVTALKEE